MSPAGLVTARRWLRQLMPFLAITVPILALTVPSVADAATVYTLEGGLVGVIPGANFTAGQLRGDHCKAPNACQKLPYTALPDGGLVDQGAASLHEAIINSDGDVLAVGHSEGGQVIYELLRDYDADPSSGPDPAKFSWISIGNPENNSAACRGAVATASAAFLRTPPTPGQRLSDNTTAGPTGRTTHPTS